MGLFSKFKEYRESRHERRAEKSLRQVRNPKAIKEDRRAALEYFKNLDDASIAIPALLQRFEYSLEHGINDTREKEFAVESIKHYGEQAIPYIKDHLLKTTRIAWPIKILSSLGTTEQVVDVLKSALNFDDVAFDRDIVDKNYDILCYLRDYQLPGFVTKLAHFLTDPDERVRFACIEALLEQDSSDVPKLVESFMADNSAENRRIKKAVVAAFLSKKWQVSDVSVFVDVQIEPGISVNKKGYLDKT